MMTKQIAAARLGREVPAAEEAIDNALLRITEVVQTSLIARRDCGVASNVGQPTLLRLHKAMGDLLGAKGEMLRAHAQLADLAVETGVMDEPYCPPAQAADLPLRAAPPA